MRNRENREWMEFARLVNSIETNSTQTQRELWAAKQPPLILSLDSRDAEDDANPECLDKGRQNGRQTPTISHKRHRQTL